MGSRGVAVRARRAGGLRGVAYCRSGSTPRAGQATFPLQPLLLAVRRSRVILHRRHRPLGRRAFVTAAGVGLLGGGRLGLGLLVGCDDSTTGNRVLLETRVTSDVAPGTSFVNDKGWEVTMERAIAAIGSIAYVEGAPVAHLADPSGDALEPVQPPARRRAPSGASARLAGLRYRLSLPSALAHPGHYVEGTVLGEVTTPALADLLGGEVSLGESEGVTGTARSAHIVFANLASAGFTEEMGDAVVIVAGVARRDGEVDRSFVAEVRAADVLPTGREIPVVEGCVLEGGSIAGDGIVHMTVRVTLWLDQVDFADVAEPTGGAAVELVAGEPPHNALARGIKKALAYHFQFSPAGG